MNDELRLPDIDWCVHPKTHLSHSGFTKFCDICGCGINRRGEITLPLPPPVCNICGVPYKSEVVEGHRRDIEQCSCLRQGHDLTEEEVRLFNLDEATETNEEEDCDSWWTNFIFVGQDIPPKFVRMHPEVTRVIVTQMSCYKWDDDSTFGQWWGKP